MTPGGSPAGGPYRVEVIDTWDMTVTALEGSFSGRVQVQLPGKEYMAIRVMPAR